LPVIVDPEHFARRLDPAYQRVEELTPLLVPYPADALEVVAVNTSVSTPTNDGPEYLPPV
jgi:putative SOS response-associated peptidase YedK